MVKRSFDIIVSLLGIVLLSPVFLMTAIAVRCSSPGPILFRQERMGRHFRPFQILKFRTMTADAPLRGGPLTHGLHDPRITRVGRVLRRLKIDELPQLINVVRGEMSLVGPRPEVAKFVNMFRADYEEILQIRPGLTDAASLKYRNESALLSAAQDAEAEYISRILPDKIAMAKIYQRDAWLGLDVAILFRTAFGL